MTVLDYIIKHKSTAICLRKDGQYIRLWYKSVGKLEKQFLNRIVVEGKPEYLAGGTPVLEVL